MSTPKRWSAITCDTDGSHIYATVNGGYIWASHKFWCLNDWIEKYVIILEIMEVNGHE